MTPRAILLIGWILFVIYAYPGYMSYDSVWQLQQARHIEPYNDWHPPMMAVLWHITDTIIAGPFPMLVLQSTTFLLGSYSLLRRVLSPRGAAICAAGLLIWPGNIVVMAVIWKDCQMAGYLLAAIALLLSDKRWHRVVGYGFIVLATGVRYNAAAGTLPIVVLLFAHHRALRWWKRVLLGSAMWFALTLLALVISLALVEKKSHVWEKGAAPIDLAGIVRYSPGITDAEILADTPGVHWVPKDHIRDYVRVRYNPDQNYMDVTELDNRSMEAPKTDEDLAAIAAAWKTMVAKHPMALLRHRISVFKLQITIRIAYIWGGFTHAEYAENQLMHKASHSRLQDFWIHQMTKWDQRFGLRVSSYLLLTLLLLPLCRGRRLPLMLLLSGLAHEAGLFLVAPAIDYRYSHWMIITCVLAIIVLFVERRRAGPGVVSAPELS